jgi:hypothetical protein
MRIYYYLLIINYHFLPIDKMNNSNFMTNNHMNFHLNYIVKLTLIKITKKFIKVKFNRQLKLFQIIKIALLKIHEILLKC